MAEQPSQYEQVLKVTGEALKVCSEATKAASEKGPPSETRSGPLQVVGRLFLGLAAIVAASASICGYIDLRLMKGISTTTSLLRVLLFSVVSVGVVGATWLVFFLARRHPSLLSSPSELDPTVQPRLMDEAIGERKSGKPKPRGKDEAPPPHVASKADNEAGRDA